MFRRLIPALALLLLLAACAAMQRSDTAAAAKTAMVGMTREEVLACMGPAKKKASEASTEVWSYLSTDGSGGTSSDTIPFGTLKHTESEHSRSFCTVNIVMRDGVVVRVNYNGPSGDNFFAPNEKCGYAVANCVDGE